REKLIGIVVFALAAHFHRMIDLQVELAVGCLHGAAAPATNRRRVSRINLLHRSSPCCGATFRAVCQGGTPAARHNAADSICVLCITERESHWPPRTRKLCLCAFRPPSSMTSARAFRFLRWS